MSERLRDGGGRGAGEGGFRELDPVIHAQARLRVVVALNALPEGDQIAFPGLRDLLNMTAGNLSVHLSKLEDAGYVSIVKTHKGRTPVTYVALTSRGRAAFDDYTAAIRELLGTAETGRNA
ncbi:DNA-binding MarR family transcriptional regulator [Thermocatellispora tengchongensis]|uniref:DNA-binding MarR family transcriptional regulator n=1 Tax=Thermocatellispora tengchongensis TaxID=1073253 RepID=A0A840NXS6_9ACTN|nr:transcriptional regulator [Thermocatellispora tengchongensis]MBB5132002.1 DNA-binding MarR family transcriptional regulator [Thermocatellispora tengchongensis]